MRLQVKAPTSIASRDIKPLVPSDAVRMDLPIFWPDGHEFWHLRSFSRGFGGRPPTRLFPPFAILCETLLPATITRKEKHMESPGRIVYRAQGNALTTRRDIVYRHEGVVDLLMDVYAPEIAHAG